jgi:hypothetical protein
MAEWGEVANALGEAAVERFMDQFPPQAHAYWVPVTGTFKKDGNTFEFEAEKHGAGFAGPVKSSTRAVFTGTVNPLTFSQK